MAAAPVEVHSGNGVLQRKQCLYKSLDAIFEIQKEMHRGQQYSQIYYARLDLMRTLLYSLVPTWKPQLPICTVLQLEEGKECIIVGTLFKHMKLKPSVLDEYSKETLEAGAVLRSLRVWFTMRYNVGKGNCVAVVAWNGPDLGGVRLLPRSIFGPKPDLDSGYLAKAFQVEKTVVEAIQAKFN